MSDTATDDVVDSGTTDDVVEETDGTEQLGDAGKQALDRMKAQAKSDRAKRRELESQLDALTKANAKDAEPDAEQLVRDAEKAANAKVAARILKSEIKAAAAGKLADPGDAHRFLDLTQFEVDEDGNVDEQEIADAINELIESKPYLAAQSGKPNHGSADAGVRKGPIQLSRDQIKSMSQDDIVAAKLAGQFNNILEG